MQDLQLTSNQYNILNTKCKECKTYNYVEELMKYILAAISPAKSAKDYISLIFFLNHLIFFLLHYWISLQVAFTGNYNEYVGFATDVDAVVYLMLTNDVIHGLFPEAVTIGEDVCCLLKFWINVILLTFYSNCFSLVVVMSQILVDSPWSSI